MPTQHKPGAEVDVGLALARELIATQMPDLAHLVLTSAGTGWDNQVYRLGEELAMRLPRRQAGADLIAREHQWLPRLAPRLPLPIALPLRLGVPQGAYPWHWSIVQWISGETAAETAIRDPARAARTLGEFLAALHTPAPAAAPVNPLRGVPLADRAASFAANLQALAGVVQAPQLLQAWSLCVAAQPAPGPKLWIHGDFHPGNLIVAAGRIAGVIDFGDLTAGDRATDLAIAWMLFERRERDLFRAAAGGIDEATWMRARGWALALGTAHLAHSADAPLHAAIGFGAINRVLADLG